MSQGRSRRVVGVVAAIALLGLLASSASASDPPLRPLDAPVFTTEIQLPPLPPEYRRHGEQGIRFAYHPSAHQRAREIFPIAEAVRTQLSRQLSQDVLASVEVRIAVGPTDFERVLPKGVLLKSPVVVFAEHETVVLGVDPDHELGALFRHGMAHLAIDEAVGRHHAVPRWLHEGYAIHFAEQAVWERGRALWWAAMRQRTIPMNELDWHLHGVVEPSSPAAAQAADLVRFLGDEPDKFGQLFAELREGNDFESALGTAYLTDEAALEHRWRDETARGGAFVPVLLGGTGLWVFLALFITLRRRRSKRRETAERPDDTPTIGPKLRVVKAPKKAADKADRQKEHGKVQLPELDVPKVSHDGRWHTLH